MQGIIAISKPYLPKNNDSNRCFATYETNDSADVCKLEKGVSEILQMLRKGTITGVFDFIFTICVQKY